ncbi:hypothetical protein [Sphingomonas sp. CARO-RG-8B-R24-01]|nr:hypothetical protein [Sphingomonas sp. CARO-RG-8B-R24-01]
MHDRGRRIVAASANGDRAEGPVGDTLQALDRVASAPHAFGAAHHLIAA